MSVVISIADIHKIYQTGAVAVHAVRGVSLTIQPGEFVAIMGASGSGKSTLMNIMGCLDRATRGHYRLDDVDVAGLTSDHLAALRNRKLGFVFQGFNLLARTTALENVELPLLYAREPMAAAEVRARAHRALVTVGLSDRAAHPPNQLSGGQQQRVAIARALVNQPVVLLADEPTGNLDTRTSLDIMGVFQELNRQGMTILMVTHELDIARFATRTLVMRDGVVVRDQPVADRLDAVAELRQAQAAHQAVHGPS